MSDDEIQKLAALARAATPQWEADLMANILCDCLSNMNEYARARAYIAAANPAAVLALIERVGELEADAALFQWLMRQYEADGELNLRAELMNAMSAEAMASP